MSCRYFSPNSPIFFPLLSRRYHRLKIPVTLGFEISQLHLFYGYVKEKRASDEEERKRLT